MKLKAGKIIPFTSRIMDQQEYKKLTSLPEAERANLFFSIGNMFYCCNSREKVKVSCYMLNALGDSWLLEKLV